MKEALFVCCNMRCLTRHMIDFAGEILETGRGGIDFHKLNTMSDGKTVTTFALAENIALAHPRGIVFDKIETCDRVLLPPDVAAALYRVTAEKTTSCPRCGSLDREVRREVFSDSSLYDERLCGDQWHNEGKPRRRVNRDWTWH